MLDFIQNNMVAILGFVGWGVSELLSLFPGVKSNGVVQLVVNIVDAIISKLKPSA